MDAPIHAYIGAGAGRNGAAAAVTSLNLLPPGHGQSSTSGSLLHLRLLPPSCSQTTLARRRAAHGHVNSRRRPAPPLVMRKLHHPLHRATATTGSSSSGGGSTGNRQQEDSTSSNSSMADARYLNSSQFCNDPAAAGVAGLTSSRAGSGAAINRNVASTAAYAHGHGHGHHPPRAHQMQHQLEELDADTSTAATVGDVQQLVAAAAAAAAAPLAQLEFHAQAGAVINATAAATATPSTPPLPLPRLRDFSDHEILSRDVDQSKAGLGIITFLRNKHIFITGATGFLAKVLVEKILREQPEVGQLYLLIHPRNKKPEQRLQDDVINSGLFEVLRKKHGYKYHEFMRSKLTLVPGNITSKGLGIDQNLAAQVASKVDVIVNSAANTNFDARYDTALNINTLGPKRVLEFGKRCPRLQIFLHVSTAYVNGTREGRTPEMPFRMGDSIAKEKFGDDAPTLDLEKELEDAQRVLDDLQYAESETVMTKVMTDFGLERAKAFGWQDTYVFTKAMGEMLIDQGRGNIPVAVVRPSVVESTLFEPFPGWMEGHRMMDPVITGYGKGQLKGFLAKPESVLDVVPCDMVVNAMLAAMVKHARQPGLAIYQVASSVVNPLTLGQLANILYEHFTKSPLLNTDGSKVKIRPIHFIPSLTIFKIFLYLNFTLPLQVRYVTKKWMEILGSLLSAKRRETYLNRLGRFKKSSEKFEHLAALYQPYTFYQGRFDITNSLNLHNELSPQEQSYFGFDVRKIDWYHYLFNIHVPGLRQHVMKGRFDN